MKLKDYINNPLGGRISIHRDFYDDMYREKFRLLLLRVNNKINYKLYFTKNTYIIHIKMPSENAKDIIYDLVIEFYSENKENILSSNLNNYDFRFFSNDPWFNYVYAYVFKEKKMIFKDLIDKFDKIVFSKKPEITNPNRNTGHIKYLYFAYLFILNKNLFSKRSYSMYGSLYNNKLFKNNIKEVNDVIDSRKKAEKVSKKKKDNKPKTNNTNIVIKNNYKKGVTKNIFAKKSKTIKKVKKK